MLIYNQQNIYKSKVTFLALRSQDTPNSKELEYGQYLKVHEPTVE